MPLVSPDPKSGASPRETPSPPLPLNPPRRPKADWSLALATYASSVIAASTSDGKGMHACP